MQRPLNIWINATVLFYRNAIISALPSLKQLDGKDVFETDYGDISGDYDQFDPERKLATGNMWWFY